MKTASIMPLMSLIIFSLLIAPVAAVAGADKAQFQKMLDEHEIRSVLDRVDLAVDAKDWKKVRGFYADEVEFDVASLEPDVQPMRMNADEMIAGWKKILFKDKKSNHMRSNFEIMVDGDSATVNSKGYSLNILATGKGSDLWEVWGDYIHTMSREKDGWKITGLTFNMVYARGNEKAHDFMPSE